MATGKTAFLKNSLTASVLVIGSTSIPASHYTDKIRPRPGAFEKSGKAHNPSYSSSLLPLPLWFGLLGFSSRASTFWRRVSYSRSPAWPPIFRLQGGPPGGELVHLGPEPFGGGQGDSVQAFQLSCRRLKQDDFASCPRRNFSLSLDWRYSSYRGRSWR